MSDPVFLRDPSLSPCPHGFFTRIGGVSEGPYHSLNCGMTSGDRPDSLQENRRRVAAAIGVPAPNLLGLTQVHGDRVVTVSAAWPLGQGDRADAMVTDRPGLALGIITADCGPVLFADPDSGVIGAAHAGWRGAIAGILERTIDAMTALGADPARTRAVVGPCIGQSSYEVGPDVRDAVLSAALPDSALPDFALPDFALPDSGRFFVPGRPGSDRVQFDLAGYCVARLLAAGIGAAHALGCDTRSDEARFFSHRRRTLAGGGPIGHQISVIALPPANQA